LNQVTSSGATVQDDQKRHAEAWYILHMLSFAYWGLRASTRRFRLNRSVSHVSGASATPIAPQWVSSIVKQVNMFIKVFDLLKSGRDELGVATYH
jgi:hypothetical protein